jgi:hypothetical protein
MQLRHNVRNCPSALKIPSRTVTRYFKERSRQCLRQYRFPLFRPPKTGRRFVKASTSVMPSDQTSAAGEISLPAISGALYTPGFPRTTPRFVNPAAPVAWDFQLMLDAHDVCGFDVTVHETLAVNLGKGGRCERICDRFSSAYSITT